MKLQNKQLGFWWRIKKSAHHLVLFFGGLLIISGLLGLLEAQLSSSEENFDLRRDASGANQVLVELVGASPENIFLGNTVTIQANINTQQLEINGVQLVLNLSGTALPEQVSAQVKGPTGLNQAYLKITSVDNNQKIAVIALPSQIGESFTNNSSQQFLEITFVPKQVGSISLSADLNQSKVTQYKVTPPINLLQSVNALNLTVNAEVTNTPTPTATPTTQATSTPTPTTTQCNFLTPDNFWAEFNSENKIDLRWKNNQSNVKKVELYLIEDGNPPSGGRILEIITDQIAPSAESYSWQIPERLLNRQYYRFLLRLIDNSNCQGEVKSDSLDRPETLPNLNINFKVQGVNKAGVTLDAMVNLKNLSQPLADSANFYGSFRSDDNGVFKPTRAISLKNLNLDPSVDYQISVKTQTSLAKNLGVMKLTTGRNVAPSAWNSSTLLVGDFVHAGDSFNVINIRDVGWLLANYHVLSSEATNELAQFDINYDGYLRFDDLAVVLANYTKLAIEGDEL